MSVSKSKKAKSRHMRTGHALKSDDDSSCSIIVVLLLHLSKNFNTVSSCFQLTT